MICGMIFLHAPGYIMRASNGGGQLQRGPLPQRGYAHGLPKTITIDGSDANEAAIKRYNEEHGTTIIMGTAGEA